MKTWAVLSIFATMALAQSSSYGSAAPSTSANPLIPAGTSSQCSDFIASFDTDSSLSACTQALIGATQTFGPGGSASTPTSAEVSSAVSNICTGSVSTACPDNLIRGKLGDFYAACGPELTSSANQQVRNLYDVLYALTPMKQAICSKDDNGNYCIVGSSSSGAPGNLDQVQQALSYVPTSGSFSRRGEDAVAANLTTFQNNYLPFLFRNGNMDTTALCTTCTRNILTSYFNYESDVMYAPGLSNSEVLGKQDALVGDIQTKCGANFLSGAVAAAGGIKSEFPNANGAAAVNDRFAGIMAVAMGGLTLAFASLL